MTFAARTLGYLSAVAGGVVSNSLNPTAQASDISPTTALITFYPNGSIDKLDPSISYGSTEWFTPIGGTPGNSYWIKITRVSGVTTAGMTSGTIYSLSTSQSIQLTAVGSLVIRVSAGTIDIYSDAGGTTRVGGGTYDINAETD
jgi:hypothetical protein